MSNQSLSRHLPRALVAGALAVVGEVHATTADVTAEYALAQQGFAIALASNVLQSHLLYVDAATGGYPYDGECTALDADDTRSGGVRVTASSPPNDDAPTPVRVQIYFEGTCQTLYMQADVNVTGTSNDSGDSYSVSNLATHYYATDGVAALATLTTNASVAATEDGAIQLHGLGAFVGAGAAGGAASLGLVCAGAEEDSALHCAGGVVQNFASLHAALGSVSPLDLAGNEDDDSLDFSSPAPAAFSTAASGGLALGYVDATDSALHVSGGSSYGSDTVSGHAGTFSLLPPPPTTWTSSDAAHDARFSIAVSDAVTRGLDFSIKRISNGASRASGHLDQSGTGSIRFSDGSTAQVRGWIITDAAADVIFANGFDSTHP